MKEPRTLPQPKDEGEDNIRSDRMDNEPPLGWDENSEELVFYASLEEAIAATKEPMIISLRHPSMDDDDISDLGDYGWMERSK